MQIKQFENKDLSHYSYAILSDCEKKIILIDPSRNPDLDCTWRRPAQGAANPWRAQEEDGPAPVVVAMIPRLVFISVELSWTLLASSLLSLYMSIGT